MYICDGCGKDCNRTTNVFVVLNLCDSCLQKWRSGELYKEEEEKNEVENDKEGE